MVVAVEVPHKPSNSPILLGRRGSKLPIEGLCNRFRAGMVFFIGVRLRYLVGDCTSCRPACAGETSSAWGW